MRVQHNIASMNSYRNYNNNTKSINKNLEKLSSGYKINRAGDDAAGLAISEKMRAQITGLAGAQKNAKDGISLVQTAEGALTEVHSMLNRMYELSEESANGTFEGTDREQLQKEVDQLRTEINRIADSSNFNGIKLLDGSLSSSGAATGNGSVLADISKFGNEFRASAKTVNSIKGKYTTNKLFTSDTTTAASLTIGNGDKFQFTVRYTDENGQEKSVTKTITMKTVTPTTATKVVLDDGTENGLDLKVDDLTSASSVTSGEMVKIMEKVLKLDDDIGGLFKVTAQTSTGQLEMEALTAGTEGAKFTGFEFTYMSKTAMDTNVIKDDGTAGGNDFTYYDQKVNVTTQAVDTTNSYDMKTANVWNNKGDQITGDAKNRIFDDLEDAIIQLNGKKFVFYNNDLTDADKAKLGAAGVDYFLKVSDASNISGSEVQQMIHAMQAETGVKITQGTYTADTSTWATNSTGTNVIFNEKIQYNLNTGTTGVGGGLKLQIGDTADLFNQLNVQIKDIHATSLGISGIDISNQNGAQTAMDALKKAINSVSDVRGTLGATQNRLEHTMNNLSVMQENIQDAESTIRDTDVADEMMKYTKNSILVQSAQAMLAQANQQPQGVLQLLQ